MSKRMLDDRGRTFTAVSYVLSALFVLIVFGILMARDKPEIQGTIASLVSTFGTTGLTAIASLGVRATADSWKKNKAADGVGPTNPPPGVG